MRTPFVFNNLSAALHEGWQVYDRYQRGYLLRRKNAAGRWEIALFDPTA